MADGFGGSALDALARAVVDDFVDEGCTGVFWRFGTELLRFRNMKLKNFSSGMYERLAYGAVE